MHGGSGVVSALTKPGERASIPWSSWSGGRFGMRGSSTPGTLRGAAAPNHPRPRVAVGYQALHDLILC
jgi:hypothetical protein